MAKIVYSENERKRIWFKIYDLMLEGKTLRQVAKELGCGINTVHYRIHKWFVDEDYQVLCDILDHNFADRLNRAYVIRRKHCLERKGVLCND